MYVGGRGRTQLRHLGRQLLGLTWKQKLRNVLLEKYPYTEWWGDGRSLCKVPGNVCVPRGNEKLETHFSLRILRILSFICGVEGWMVFQGPVICAVLPSLNSSRKEGHLKRSPSCFESTFQRSMWPWESHDCSFSDGTSFSRTRGMPLSW